MAIFSVFLHDGMYMTLTLLSHNFLMNSLKEFFKILKRGKICEERGAQENQISLIELQKSKASVEPAEPVLTALLVWNEK